MKLVPSPFWSNFTENQCTFFGKGLAFLLQKLTKKQSTDLYEIFMCTSWSRWTKLAIVLYCYSHWPIIRQWKTDWQTVWNRTIWWVVHYRPCTLKMANAIYERYIKVDSVTSPVRWNLGRCISLIILHDAACQSSRIMQADMQLAKKIMQRQTSIMNAEYSCVHLLNIHLSTR
jgi:hypothetical protein